ncbi:TRAP transporter substrate-binding protein [Cecembia calidifontis]|jgi:tripartite ATP-independent transporter DctP family solute receptor|uniref:Tripartite ATP-independent transporter DctP family solute receptor n=1 Tax=Cecembia calidifontis TaxID=1187080 RepID=A0A4Q7P7K8_9BACT|nr:TRAP transporter substrate-binding protein [Cecembia calidifontis]RZS95807.1 tripartite ATP-independent transporter DctP family solute receptor [Cecembia calidifontis]
MQVLRLIGFCLISVLLFSCVDNSSRENAEFVLRFGHLANEQNIWHKAALKFAEEVKQRSDGRILVKVYPNEQLGKEMDMITGILAEVIDIMITAESLENWSLPYAILCATPYAIRDSDHLHKVAGGAIGKEMEQHIIDVAGLKPIAYFERGARNLTSNVPVRHPDDLKGLIIRVPNVSLYVSTWSALGAKPTPMAFSEVFTALQQSTIHGQENPFALIRNAGLFEVQKYVNLTEHVKGWAYVVMGNKQFEKLPEDLQQVIMVSAKIMQEYEHSLFLEQEALDVQFLKNKGMEFIEVDKEAFEKLAKKAVRESFTKEQMALYERIQQVR